MVKKFIHYFTHQPQTQSYCCDYEVQVLIRTEHIGEYWARIIGTDSRHGVNYVGVIKCQSGAERWIEVSQIVAYQWLETAQVA